MQQASSRAVVVFFLCVLGVSGVGPSLAQEQVVVAGQDGVKAPRRTKTVPPSYPQEALAQGVRGIVILELLIDPQGKVQSAEVIRSIPLLDEAALSAVRNWEYEVTQVDGKPVSVKLTVPITFALKIPEVTRAPGIPELRQGASVQFPAGQTSSSTVAADVTLDPDGQVAEAQILEGTDPWAGALLSALRTWRFAAEGDNVVLSFRVDADFVARGDKPKVEIRLSGLRRSESMPGEAADADVPSPAEDSTPSTPASPGAPPEEPAATKPVPAPAAEAPAAPATPASAAPAAPVPGPAASETRPAAPLPAPEPASPATAGPVPPAASPAPLGSTPPVTPPAAAAPPAQTTPTPPASPPAESPAGPAAGPPAPVAPRPGAPTSAEAKGQTPAAPPVEILTAPRPPEAPAPPPEPGVSAIRDVTLGTGVPDLVRGRRPVPPPVARMSGTTGTVDVKFSVDAAGLTSVAEVAGPEALKNAATYTVQSWLFRRVTPQRIYLVATFDYAGETAKASVKSE